MPYIITTTPAREDFWTHGEWVGEFPTRRAVATLDDPRWSAKPGARSIVLDEIKRAHAAYGQSWDNRWEGWSVVEWYIGYDGGTVGPLPDGTEITVERVSRLTLGARLVNSGHPTEAGLIDNAPLRLLIDAYNAAQER